MASALCELKSTYDVNCRIFFVLQPKYGGLFVAKSHPKSHFTHYHYCSVRISIHITKSQQKLMTYMVTL